MLNVFISKWNIFFVLESINYTWYKRKKKYSAKFSLISFFLCILKRDACGAEVRFFLNVVNYVIIIFIPVVMTYFLQNMYDTQKKHTEVDIHFAISTLKGSSEMTLSAFYYFLKEWNCSQRLFIFIFDILCPFNIYIRMAAPF